MGSSFESIADTECAKRRVCASAIRDDGATGEIALEPAVAGDAERRLTGRASAEQLDDENVVAQALQTLPFCGIAAQSARCGLRLVNVEVPAGVTIARRLSRQRK